MTVATKARNELEVEVQLHQLHWAAKNKASFDDLDLVKVKEMIDEDYCYLI